MHRWQPTVLAVAIVVGLLGSLGIHGDVAGIARARFLTFLVVATMSLLVEQLRSA
jgi:uncharacterized membrane protein YtjA (UPF0391 family)